MATSNISSFFWKFGERALVQGVGLFVQIFLARLLMPNDFACLAIINTIIVFLGLFVQSGLSTTVIQKQKLESEDLSTLVTCSLFIALFLYVFLFFTAPIINEFYHVDNLTWPIRVMGLSLFLYSYNSVQSGILSRKMMFKAIFLRSAISMPISAAFGIAMAYLGYGVWALIAYNLLNILLICIFMNLMPELRVKLAFSFGRAIQMYSFSYKILFSQLICASGDTIRTMTIGKYASPPNLAYYDRGLSYSNLVVSIVNTSLASVILPLLSRSQKDLSKLKEMVRRSVGISGFVMIPILVLVSLIAEPLVVWVFSDKWQPCAIYLSIFCLMRIPGVLTTVDKQAYLALGKSQIGMYYELALLITNIIILIITVPHGVIYVAIGSTIVEYLGNISLFMISKKIINYGITERFKDLWKSLISTSVMALVICFIYRLPIVAPYRMLLQITTAFLVYSLISCILKDKNLYYIKDKFNR